MLLKKIRKRKILKIFIHPLFSIKLIIAVLGLSWVFQVYAATAEQNLSHQSHITKHNTQPKLVPLKNVSKKNHKINSHHTHKQNKNLKKHSKKNHHHHKIHQKPQPKTYAHLNHHLETYCGKALDISNTPTSLTGSIEQHLVTFVHNVVATLHYNTYKLGGTHFDTSRGIYMVDCSDYVNHLLQVVYPDAYSDLLDSIGSDKPTSQLYYNFFSGLSDASNRSWSKVDDAEELQPGDIIVFRNKARGHVMVVMDKPIHDNDVLLVRITDSAPSAHSEDTRLPSDSGIGIGTLLLKVNSHTGHLAAYAWKEGAHWESNVNFAMARPLEVG